MYLRYHLDTQGKRVYTFKVSYKPDFCNECTSSSMIPKTSQLCPLTQRDSPQMILTRRSACSARSDSTSSQPRSQHWRCEREKKTNVTLNDDSHAIESSGLQMLASFMQLDIYAAIKQTVTALTSG